MARKVFVDTSFLVAVLDHRDRWHERAMELTSDLDEHRAEMITTDAVLLEMANYFSRSPLRQHAIEWISAIREAGGWHVIELKRTLLARAEFRYSRHPDKSWSLTDCISMEVMEMRRMREAATTDVHFSQAGYSVLMRE